MIQQSPSGIYSKELKSGPQRDGSIPMFFVGLLTKGKMWKQLKCLLMEEWIKKRWYIYTHTMTYYSALKKEEFLQYATI